MRIGFYTTLFSLLFPIAAEASVFFAVERLSDRRAKITGSGVFDILTERRIGLVNAIEVGPSSLEFVYNGTMVAGPTELTRAFTEGNLDTLILGFDGDIPVGSTLLGSAYVFLKDVKWSFVSQTGDAIDAISGDTIGSFEIVLPPASVPLPPSVFGGLLALGSLAALSRRRRKTPV